MKLYAVCSVRGKIIFGRLDPAEESAIDQCACNFMSQSWKKHTVKIYHQQILPIVVLLWKNITRDIFPFPIISQYCGGSTGSRNPSL